MSEYESGGYLPPGDVLFSPEEVERIAARIDGLRDGTITITNAYFPPEEFMPKAPAVIPPEPHSSNGDDIGYSEIDVKIRTFTDGTVTVVQIIHVDEVDTPFGGKRKKENLLGEGRARRQKGDRRDSTLGFGLASTRAFEHAAAISREDTAKRLNGG